MSNTNNVKQRIKELKREDNSKGREIARILSLEGFSLRDIITALKDLKYEVKIFTKFCQGKLLGISDISHNELNFVYGSEDGIPKVFLPNNDNSSKFIVYCEGCKRAHFITRNKPTLKVGDFQTELLRLHRLFGKKKCINPDVYFLFSNFNSAPDWVKEIISAETGYNK